MKKLSVHAMFAASLVVTVLMSSGNRAVAQVTVFTDPIQFALVTGAVDAPIPPSQTAFPDALCGGGPPGSGIGTSVHTLFDTNWVTVTNPVTGVLCIFDKDYDVGEPNNTDPQVMLANTIVGNGEDDFLVVFDRPVLAVGFRFLTNKFHQELLTFKDEQGNIIGTPVDIAPLTPPNAHVFVGFLSTTRISEDIGREL